MSAKRIKKFFEKNCVDESEITVIDEMYKDYAKKMDFCSKKYNIKWDPIAETNLLGHRFSPEFRKKFFFDEYTSKAIIFLTKKGKIANVGIGDARRGTLRVICLLNFSKEQLRKLETIIKS